MCIKVPSPVIRTHGAFSLGRAEGHREVGAVMVRIEAGASRERTLVDAVPMAKGRTIAARPRQALGPAALQARTVRSSWLFTAGALRA